MSVCQVLAVVLVVFVFTSLDAARARNVSADCDSWRDGKPCAETLFLLAMFRSIKLTNQEIGEGITIAPVKARCLDYHHAKGEVYAYSNNTIMRYSVKGRRYVPSMERLVTRTETAVTSIAVDWRNDLVYYIAEQQSVIYVTSREGGDQRVVISHNDTDTQPGWRSLVVDPHHKKLYWVGTKGVYYYSIERKELLDNMIPWLHHVDSIFLDIPESLIYAIGWRENATNKVITSANTFTNPMLLGFVNDTVEVELPSNQDIYGFAVIGKIAYWESNHEGENIYKCNLEAEKTPVSPVVVVELNQIVYDMKVVNKDLQIQ